MLKDLDRLGADRLTKIAILNRSIQNNWKGVFELPDGYVLPQVHVVALEDGSIIETEQQTPKNAFDKLREKYGE